MNERLKLTNKDNETIETWAELLPRTGGESVDEFVEQGDRFTFRIHRTARNREFLSDLTAVTAEATRAMPERHLDVSSVRPTADRAFLEVECHG